MFSYCCCGAEVVPSSSELEMHPDGVHGRNSRRLSIQSWEKKKKVLNGIPAVTAPCGAHGLVKGAGVQETKPSGLSSTENPET